MARNFDDYQSVLNDYSTRYFSESEITDAELHSVITETAIDVNRVTNFLLKDDAEIEDNKQDLVEYLQRLLFDVTIFCNLSKLSLSQITGENSMDVYILKNKTAFKNLAIIQMHGYGEVFHNIAYRLTNAYTKYYDAFMSKTNGNEGMQFVMYAYMDEIISIIGELLVILWRSFDDITL